MDQSVEVTTPNVDGGPPLGAGSSAGAQNTGNEQGGQQQMQSQQSQSSDKVVAIPTSAMKRIKEEERSRGKAEAVSYLAQKAGFESEVDLIAALGALKGGGQSQQSQQSQPAAQPSPAAQQQSQQVQNDDLKQVQNERREAAKYERMVEKLTRERDTYATKFQQTQEQLKKQKEMLDAKEAEMSLREIAVGCGVTDVDYALRLFYREIEGKPEAELAKLDEKAFFTNLRQGRPYLFGEVVQKASTGPGVGAAPTAPKPGQAQQQQAASGQFDGRAASKSEVSARLAKMGLNPHL